MTQERQKGSEKGECLRGNDCKNTIEKESQEEEEEKKMIVQWRWRTRKRGKGEVQGSSKKPWR